MIANKHYPLSPDFNPGEDPEAVSALHELIAAMQAEGYPISDQYSGFVATTPKLASTKTMSIKMVRRPQIVILQDRVIVNTRQV